MVGKPPDAQRSGNGVPRRGRGVGRERGLEKGTRSAPEAVGKDIGSEGPFTHGAELAVARADEGERVLVGEPTRTQAERTGEFRVEGARMNREPKLVSGGSFLEDGRVPGEEGEGQGTECVGNGVAGRGWGRLSSRRDVPETG